MGINKYQFRGCASDGSDSFSLHSNIAFHILPPIEIFTHKVCVLISLYSVVIVSNWSFERIDQLKEGRNTIMVSPIKLG